MDGTEGVEGVAVTVRGRFGRSWASLRYKLGLTSLNRRCANSTHDGEVRRLEIRDRRMANDPRNSRKKDKLITTRCILIDIYKGENEMIGKVYSKVLNEGKKKSSMRLDNGVIVRQRMENKCHHHIKELQTFCKTQA